MKVRRSLRHVVWDLTDGCNLRCLHCELSAGQRDPEELDHDEALALTAALGELGCRTVTLSGGEPLLRPDWSELVRRIRSAGMAAEMMTNGVEVLGQLDQLEAARLHGLSLSVDGLSELHDQLRGRPGALEELLDGATALRRTGQRLGAVTQVNRRNRAQLEAIHEMIVEAGFDGWLVQLTLPMGRAATAGLCLEPSDLPELARDLVALASRSPLRVQVADSIGWLSRLEPRLRTNARRRSIWTGCQAGLSVVGITSDGRVRGCLSMPAALDEPEGDLKLRSLREIWDDAGAFAYNRRFDPARLEGACSRCALGAICRAGCTAVAAVTTGGSTTTNPNCLRALED